MFNQIPVLMWLWVSQDRHQTLTAAPVDGLAMLGQHRVNNPLSTVSIVTNAHHAAQTAN